MYATLLRIDCPLVRPSLSLNVLVFMRSSSSQLAPPNLCLCVYVCICLFLVACYATLQPALSVRRSVRPSVRPSVRRSVRHTLLFLGFCGFWPHCSCPNDGVTSIMAPAHPHATGIVVYPAFYRSCVPSVCQSIANTFLVSSHALLSHALFEIRKMI